MRKIESLIRALCHFCLTLVYILYPYNIWAPKYNPPTGGTYSSPAIILQYNSAKEEPNTPSGAANKNSFNVLLWQQCEEAAPHKKRIFLYSSSSRGAQEELSQRCHTFLSLHTASSPTFQAFCPDLHFSSVP